MKKNRKDRFYNFMAAMMFQFDVDWDEELPAILPDEPKMMISTPAISIHPKKQPAFAKEAAS